MHVVYGTAMLKAFPKPVPAEHPATVAGSDPPPPIGHEYTLPVLVSVTYRYVPAALTATPDELDRPGGKGEGGTR